MSKAVKLPDERGGIIQDEYTAGNDLYSQRRVVVKCADGSEVDIAFDRVTPASLEEVL